MMESIMKNMKNKIDWTEDWYEEEDDWVRSSLKNTKTGDYVKLKYGNFREIEGKIRYISVDGSIFINKNNYDSIILDHIDRRVHHRKIYKKI